MGHPSRLKIDTLARPFSEEVFAIDILAESRFTFRQGQTVQPFAMVSGKKVCRYQDVSQESQTRGHSVRIVWQMEAQKKCAFVRVVSVQGCFACSTDFFLLKFIVIFLGGETGDILSYHNSSLEPQWLGSGQRTSTRG